MVEGPTVGRLIKRLRASRGLTQGQLAAFAKVTRAWLSLVETDQIGQPDREMLERVASILHEHPETLLAAAGYRVTALPPRDRRTIEEVLAELQAVMRESPILVDETVQSGSAGPGGQTDAERWPYWPSPEERGHEFIAVPVSGDCLEPRLRPGERAIVDKTQEPRPGDIVLAYRDGEALLKILERRDGEFWLVALQGQPAIRVDDQVQLAGVVKFAGHRP